MSRAFSGKQQREKEVLLTSTEVIHLSEEEIKITEKLYPEVFLKSSPQVAESEKIWKPKTYVGMGPYFIIQNPWAFFL